MLRIFFVVLWNPKKRPKLRPLDSKTAVEAGSRNNSFFYIFIFLSGFYVTPTNFPLYHSLPGLPKLDKLPTAAAADLATLYRIRRMSVETAENPCRYRRP